MKDQIIQFLFEESKIIISSGLTLVGAWITRKLEMRKLKKEGRLFDEVNYNGSVNYSKKK